MTQQWTREKAESRADAIRAALARSSDTSRYTIEQLTDNPVRSENPYGWNIQLRDSRTNNSLLRYVGTDDEFLEIMAEIAGQRNPGMRN